MIDKITRSFVNQFLGRFEIKSIDDSKDFEKFCNYTILTREYGADIEFDLDDVATGDDNKGIDGLAIILNEKVIVTTKQDIDDIIETNKQFSVDYIFIQSKTENNFNGPDIRNFGTTVRDFFIDKPRYVMTKKVQDAFELKKYLEDNYAKSSRTPYLKLYYVTLGKWSNDQSLLGDISYNTKDLEGLNYFGKVTFEPIDALTIQNYDRKLRESVNASFAFEKQFDLPAINDVDNAYYGLVSFDEFKNIIIDENGKIKNIFYDNVRDFLGENDVNKKISETLANKHFDWFAILNNGVTVVAEEKKEGKGGKFSIFNYQIVNGCQTSHVIFNNKEISGIEKIRVPLRLIVTTNEDVKTQITLATNRQTGITEEQLAAFSEFQKNLEQYYKAIPQGDTKLYYERRTGQYNSDLNIYKTRIITIKNQIKVVASMFLEKPHLVSGYYGKVFKSVESAIFQKNDKYIIYYVSALALYKLETFLRIKNIDAKYNKIRYHMLMLFRILTGGEIMPKYFNSNEMENYCENILGVLKNNQKSLEKFKEVTEIINKSGISIDKQKPLYQENTTKTLLETIKKHLTK